MPESVAEPAQAPHGRTSPVQVVGANKGAGQKKKKKNRCRGCRTRLTTVRLSCEGCGRSPLCIGCVAPEKHACTHDWKGAYRDRLRRENAPVRPTTLRDAL